VAGKVAGASGQATAGGITASQCRRHGINEHHGTDEGWRKFITVPGSALAASEFVPDILATDGQEAPERFTAPG